eukprot:3310408-Alexandrium_andersonii.AAC.1
MRRGSGNADSGYTLAAGGRCGNVTPPAPSMWRQNMPSDHHAEARCRLQPRGPPKACCFARPCPLLSTAQAKCTPSKASPQIAAGSA